MNTEEGPLGFELPALIEVVEGAGDEHCDDAKRKTQQSLGQQERKYHRDAGDEQDPERAGGVR